MDAGVDGFDVAAEMVEMAEAETEVGVEVEVEEEAVESASARTTLSAA